MTASSETMSFSEEEVKRAADLKLWVEGRIFELESEISKLRETLLVVDAVLRTTSFRPASEFQASGTAEMKPTAVSATLEAPTLEETKEIRRRKDGQLMAVAHISKARLVIEPAEDLKLSPDIPPFKSFFVNRILEGMRAKDAETLAQEKIKSGEVLNYRVDEKDAVIQKIVIENYREKSRLNEIMNTVAWAFSRMLEKKG